MENALLENQQHPSLLGLLVQYFDKLYIQVATMNRFQQRFGEYIQLELGVDGSQLQHLMGRHEACARRA